MWEDLSLFLTSYLFILLATQRYDCRQARFLLFSISQAWNGHNDYEHRADPLGCRNLENILANLGFDLAPCLGKPGLGRYLSKLRLRGHLFAADVQNGIA